MSKCQAFIPSSAIGFRLCCCSLIQFPLYKNVPYNPHSCSHTGSSALKSTELLYRLLEREESYQAHAASLITLAKDTG